MISTIALDEPQTRGDIVRFSWSVSPESALARETTIELQFPNGLDLARVPRGVLWIAALAVLHPLWILLRPCRVRLPFAFSPGEAEFWQRLLDTEIASLEALRGTRFFERCIFFEYAGDALPVPTALPERGRVAAAFSGGKDSLLQAAVLHELGMTPTLVTTTSPLPPLGDHLTNRRAYVLREATKRFEVPLVEVRSNARGLWENGFAARLGYPLAVSEMTDTHLYFASLLIAGVASGSTQLFLASEADVQTSAVRDGRFVQISHFMYSVVTQACLAALLAPWNVRYGSLTSPLFNAQVQRLLWTRYPEVADLQYSCWRVAGDDATCSDCNQCLRVALGILAAGRDPRDAGFAMDRVVRRASSWFPKAVAGDDAEALPEALSRASLSDQLIATVRSIDPAFARSVLSDDAFDAFAAFAARLATESIGPIGRRSSFDVFLDPAVRDRACALYAQAFPGAAAEDSVATAARTRDAIAYVTAPLSPGG